MKSSAVCLALALILLSGFSSLTVADLLGDLKEAADFIKQASGMLPDNENTTVPVPAASILGGTNQSKKQSPDTLPLKKLVFLITKPGSYYERPQYFDSLDFDIGEITVIEPMDKAVFNTLYVPSYKGIPRLGLTPGYSDIKSDVNLKNAISERLTNDMLIYHNLRLLAVMEKYITEENLKATEQGEFFSIRAKPRSFDSRRSTFTYTPRYHIESLASTLLPKAHDIYFCGADTCKLSRNFNRAFNEWGGVTNINEFKKRRAYFKFVETEVPKLKAWAKSLTPEVYVVGNVFLGGYDFKQNGFNLKPISPPITGSPRKPFHYAPRDKTERVFAQLLDGKIMAGQSFFISLDLEKAKALQDQTANGSVSMLYFAVKGQVHNAYIPKVNARKHNNTSAGVDFAFEITGSAVEFFSDELLKNKLFEVPIN